MPREFFDPKLKEAAEEIKVVLRKHDIAGVFELFNGEGHAEFIYHIEEPTWSCLHWDKEGIRFRAKAKTGGPMEKAKAAATINMIHIMRDVASNTFEFADRLVKLVHQHFDIEVEKGRFTYNHHMKPGVQS